MARSETVLASIGDRRAAAEDVLDAVVPRAPERGPATRAEDVLDDIKLAEAQKVKGNSPALRVLDEVIKAKAVN